MRSHEHPHTHKGFCADHENGYQHPHSYIHSHLHDHNIDRGEAHFEEHRNLGNGHDITISVTEAATA